MEAIGVLSALGAALSWAMAAVVTKSLTARIDAFSLNALRVVFAIPFVLAVAAASGRLGMLADLSPADLFIFTGGNLLGIVAGETLFLLGITLMEVSRGYPISMSFYALLTVGIAALWIREPITWSLLAGAVLILSGNYQLSTSQAQSGPGSAHDGSRRLRGILLLLASASMWAVAVNIQSLVIADLDAIAVNIFRLPFIALALLAMVQVANGGLSLKRFSGRDLWLAALAGTLTFGVGGLLFFVALERIGAGPTAILTSLSPLIAQPVAFLFLRERLARVGLVGVGMGIIGVWLVLS